MTRQRDDIPLTTSTSTEQHTANPWQPQRITWKKLAELLANDDDRIDLEYLRTIIGTAMKQQSKEDTLRRLASNPEACVSTVQNQPTGRQYGHHDDQSRTGSRERQRKTKEHPNRFPYLRILLRIKLRGRIQCSLERTSTVTPRHQSIAMRHRALAQVVQPEMSDPTGLAELTSATMLGLGEVGMTIAKLKECAPDVKEAAAKMAVEATAARAITTKRDEENLMAEARGITSPRTALRHRHQVREAEAEAEYQNLSRTPLMADETLGNA
jgi:hypothetical protein